MKIKNPESNITWIDKRELEAMGILATSILDEAVNRGYADYLDKTWNPEAHVEITLTVKEIRMAHKILEKLDALEKEGR